VGGTTTVHGPLFIQKESVIISFLYNAYNLAATPCGVDANKTIIFFHRKVHITFMSWHTCLLLQRIVEAEKDP
jgi:hypothetical protein